ncbi:MAG TPA: type VI secretion system protein IglI family protein [Polyangiaceae bacterium]|nr:type VI secretion system protein IglI family protein [Polyangiaceae bacterium]
MARALEPLRRPLSPGPELDPLDPRLAAVVDAAERRQFREAADRAEALFAEGVYDVQAVSIYLYQAFAEGGLGALGELFATAEALAGDNLGALSPARRREERLDRRLGWLFDTVNDALEYHVLKNTPDWARWREGVGPDAFAEALARGEALGGRLRAGGFKAGEAGLGRLLTRLQPLAPVLAPPPAPAPPPAAAQAPAAAVASPAAHATLEPSRHRVELVASDKFVELLCKLRAFEALVERKNYQKAALVGDDLLQTLDDFDPRAYFPELFAGFSALFSEHVDQLAPHWGDRDTITWKALAQFYRVDLKGFVGG